MLKGLNTSVKAFRSEVGGEFVVHSNITILFIFN